MGSSILDATHNIKHKTLLALLYSGGLRIGEALSMRVTDVDSKRGLLFVRSAKGKKDRYTLLSVKILDMLCPNNSCIYLMSVPFSNKCVAKLCRNVCNVIPCLKIPARLTACANTSLAVVLL